MRGEEIVAPEPVEVAPVIDLMEALKASVAAAKKQPESAEKPARTRRARTKAS
jgi:non-homologous end joining protein Ku